MVLIILTVLILVGLIGVTFSFIGFLVEDELQFTALVWLALTALLGVIYLIMHYA